MQLQFTPYVFPVAATAVILAVLALATWRHRPAQGAMYFCLLMLAMAEWSLGYALELTSRALSSAHFWDNIAWIGAIAAPMLWLIFVLRYTGRANWLARRNLAFLAVEPLITLLLFLGAFVLCSFVLTVARFAHLYYVQGACLLVAVLAPWVGNVLTISGLSPLPYLNLTPFAFLISGLALSAGLFIFRLLDIVPVAREIVIESMTEAIFVLDAHDRVVDLNLAARRLVNFNASKAVGRPFAEVFRTWPELVELCRDPLEVDEEVIVSEGEAPRYYGLRITPLHCHNEHLTVTGRLIISHDITKAVQAERALKESEERFRSIFAEVPDA